MLKTIVGAASVGNAISGAVRALACRFSPWPLIPNHLAYFHHEGKTAAWAGNSPDIIQHHYKGLVKQADAKEFWAVKPPQNHVQIPLYKKPNIAIFNG